VKLHRNILAFARRHWHVGAAALLTAVAGCARELHSSESALAPAGPQAQRIATLTWMFMGVCAVVYVLVILALFGALLHRRKASLNLPNNDPVEPDMQGEKRTWTTVLTCTGITVITLFVLLIADFSVGRAAYKFSTADPDPMHIQIIGHQWWWEIHYTDWPDRFGERMAYNTFATANEFHIPVDPDHPVSVQLDIESHDVIHSFWVPNLSGKRDLIPGHGTSLWIRADHPGTYYGECAEYCGYQHANMRLVVVAEPVEKFRAWLDAQRTPPPEPTTEAQKRGRDVFMHTACATCHTIGGTSARGLVGPNLTHVGSRILIAGGALQNVPGNLGGWIIDPQRIKPGAVMPRINLAPDDLRNLLEYVQSLK